MPKKKPKPIDKKAQTLMTAINMLLDISMPVRHQRIITDPVQLISQVMKELNESNK